MAAQVPGTIEVEPTTVLCVGTRVVVPDDPTIGSVVTVTHLDVTQSSEINYNTYVAIHALLHTHALLRTLLTVTYNVVVWRELRHILFYLR